MSRKQRMHSSNFLSVENRRSTWSPRPAGREPAQERQSPTAASAGTAVDPNHRACLSQPWSGAQLHAVPSCNPGTWRSDIPSLQMRALQLRGWNVPTATARMKKQEGVTLDRTGISRKQSPLLIERKRDQLAKQKCLQRPSSGIVEPRTAGGFGAWSTRSRGLSLKLDHPLSPPVIGLLLGECNEAR
ncbi:60S ribosomal protein L22 isoform X2 [Cebus imitator]|uniref:60S ribosomal protein L22 isoform X2 n=1 Tax=Cebus imitator TaxID=2715852 RepID=UPI001899D2C4|nr:60S ribosomal protein L22 isoform X2 [Cebus imitator]